MSVSQFPHSVDPVAPTQFWVIDVLCREIENYDLATLYTKYLSTAFSWILFEASRPPPRKTSFALTGVFWKPNQCF